MRAVRGITPKNSVLLAGAAGAEQNFPAYRISTQKENIYRGIACGADGVGHLLRPIFVGSDGEEGFAAQQSFGVLMCVYVRNVGQVVAFFLPTETEWMFPT